MANTVPLDVPTVDTSCDAKNFIEKSRKATLMHNASPRSLSPVRRKRRNSAQPEITDEVRMSLLEGLIKERKANYQYMRKVHASALGSGEKVYWMNSIFLSEEDLLLSYSNIQLDRLMLKWASLGLSIGRLLSLPINASGLINSMLQLLFEFEYHFSSGVTKSAKYLLAKDSSPFFHQAPSVVATVTRPQLYKYRNELIYEQLVLPHDLQNDANCCSNSAVDAFASQLDYFQVAQSLCDVLLQLYSKLLDPISATAPMYDSLLQIDQELKSVALNVFGKEVNARALELVRAHLGELQRCDNDSIYDLFSQ